MKGTKEKLEGPSSRVVVPPLEPIISYAEVDHTPNRLLYIAGFMPPFFKAYDIIYVIIPTCIYVLIFSSPLKITCVTSRLFYACIINTIV